MTTLFNRIIKISIYLLVFLMPLFWLPFSLEAFEFNKQYLLFFLVSLALFAWLAKMVFIDKEIRFKKTPLDIFVLAFLFIAILSAIFSVDRISSVFGFYGRFSDNLIGLLSLGALYFLITNNVQINGDKNADKQKLSIGGIIKAFSWSVFFVVLFSYFSIFGLWLKLNSIMGGVFPAVMLQDVFNLTSGSMEGLTIFLAAIIVLFTGLLLNYKTQKFNFQNILYLILILASLGILEIIDYNLAWIILLIGLLAFFISALITRIFKENVSRLLLPIFLIIIAVIFLLFDVSSIAIRKEYVINQGISWQIAFGAATDNVKSGFLGSGVGTYFYDFAKFKPAAFNQNPLWYINFDRSGSHFAEVFGTTGFLGLLAYLALIGIFLIISCFLIRTKVSSFQLPLLIASLTLVAGQFIYYQNTILAFTFWLMLGLGVCCWQAPLNSVGGNLTGRGPIKEKVISFKNLPELSLIFSTFLIIFGVAILVLYYFGASYYLADVNYYKGLTLLGQERIEKLERAVKLNPTFSQYRLALSQSFLYEFFQEAQKPLEQQELSKMQAIISRSIEETGAATNLQPNLAANWINSGLIYRDVINSVEGALERSISSFEKAAALDPANPIIYTELSKLYSDSAVRQKALENQQKASEDQQKAKEYIQNALEKKSNYADAIIQQALILERENILNEAIEKLEDLIINKDPWNIEAHFQLGRLYYNAGRIDEAIALFGAVATVIPQHSNSLYSLGIAYIAKGMTQEAILAFERVLELNPGNQDVIQKLEELKKQGSPQERLEEQPEEEKEGAEEPKEE